VISEINDLHNATLSFQVAQLYRTSSSGPRVYFSLNPVRKVMASKIPSLASTDRTEPC
jgi:hypothetical protein